VNTFCIRYIRIVIVRILGKLQSMPVSAMMFCSVFFLESVWTWLGKHYFTLQQVSTMVAVAVAVVEIASVGATA